MSYVSSITLLSNVSSASRITALAAYSRQNIGVCLFLGNASGNLYVYDLSYALQKEFNVSLSGTVFVTGAITGLATSDQYLFVNSPGKCFQVPLAQMFFNGNWGVTIGPPNLFPVANCWNGGISNMGGIAVTPAADTLFMLYTPSTLSKISPPDSLADLVIDAANVPFYVSDLSRTLTNITIDSRNTTVYFGDTSSKSVYRYNYSSGSNGVILSNVYFQDSHLVVSTCGMAFSPSTTTLAYGRTDFYRQSSIDAWNPRIEQYTTIAGVGYFNNVASLAYDSNDTLYIAAQQNLSVSSSPYYLWTNTFVYSPRPAPSVEPPRQRPVKCGLIEPGSCKRAYQPFSPRERFGWGSPNRPYLTPDNNVGCPPVYVTSCTPSSSPGHPSPPDPDVTPPVNPAPSIATSTTQYLTRTRVATSNYVVNLNSNSFAANSVTPPIQSSPTFDYSGRVYYTANGVGVYYTDNYATVNTLITLGDSATSSLTAGPACSAVDRTLALGNSDGYVLMVDPTKSFPNILAWEQQFSGAGAAAVTSLAYIENYVYASTSNALACFLASDGTPQWTATPALVGGDTYSSQINVQNGNVFIGTTRGTLWSYSPITGQSLFSIPVNTGPILGTANIDTSSRVFFGSGSNLFACPIDRTQSAYDLVYTNIVGNITAGVTLAVDSAKSTRAFFTTDAKRTYCVQIDSNVGACTDPGYIINNNSLPILDISYMYVVGGTGSGGSIPCVFRFPSWYSVDLTSGFLNAFGSYFNVATTTSAPNLLINLSSSIVFLTNTGLFTLS